MTLILQMSNMCQGFETCTGSPNEIELGLEPGCWVIFLHSLSWSSCFLSFLQRSSPPLNHPCKASLDSVSFDIPFARSWPLKIHTLTSSSSISAWSVNLFLILMVPTCVLNSLFLYCVLPFPGSCVMPSYTIKHHTASFAIVLFSPSSLSIIKLSIKYALSAPTPWALNISRKSR